MKKKKRTRTDQFPKGCDMWYDKRGNPITLQELAPLYEDMKYRRIAEDTLPDGTWISTVWLGLDHSFGDGPPLIFETMVFPSNKNMDEQDMDRYATEEEAREGHARMVAKWRGK